MFPAPVFAPWQIGVVAIAASILTTLVSWSLKRWFPGWPACFTACMFFTFTHSLGT